MRFHEKNGCINFCFIIIKKRLSEMLNKLLEEFFPNETIYLLIWRMDGQKKSSLNHFPISILEIHFKTIILEKLKKGQQFLNIEFLYFLLPEISSNFGNFQNGFFRLYWLFLRLFLLIIFNVPFRRQENFR